MTEFKNLHISRHPLVLDRLSRMRDKDCTPGSFKRYLEELAILMGYEVTLNLPVETRKVETPLAVMDAPFLAADEPMIVPILRAGLGMAEIIKNHILPSAVVAHIGVYRDEETHEPVPYMDKLPADTSGRKILLVDPMLATGGSAKYALDLIVSKGARPEDIIFMALVAAPEGVRFLHEFYPDLPIYVAALDDHLNEKAYIVPGLGDAGDRIFGTLFP